LRHVKDFQVLPPLSLLAHFPQPVFDAVAKSVLSTSQHIRTQGNNKVFVSDTGKKLSLME
jgi:hypothetical protein